MLVRTLIFFLLIAFSIKADQNDTNLEYLFEIFERSEMTAAIVARPEDDPYQLTPRDMVNNFVIRGSAETVTSQLLDFYNQVGGFGTILMTAHDWIDKTKMKRSMELMATRVLPAVNQHLAASD